MRVGLDLRRVTPEPGPDADAVAHAWVGTLEAPGGPAALEVAGIATVWDLRVDGVVVASGRSMFAPARVELDLAAGPHEVRVDVHPLADLIDAVPRRPRARWRTALVAEPRLRWARTTVLGRAPGFAPGPPVVGPYRPVVLVAGEPLRGLELRTRVERGTGLLDVRLDLDPRVPVPRRLEVELSGPSGVVRAPVVDGAARLEVDAVATWRPHTHGTPHLHDVRVLGDGGPLALPGDGTLADPTVRRTGFRTLGSDRDAADAPALRVDGVAVFVRGAVWTPGSLAALDEAAALGLDAVRVSGVAGWESDAFHARCDALGLLVWHDLPLATLDYPLADDDFRSGLVAEVDTQVRRLLGHPSTVVVCGSAEHEQQAALVGVRPDGGAARELAALLRPVVAATGVDALWVDSTPTGGEPVTRTDTGVAQYFGVGAYRRPLADARTAGVRFAAEALAFSHLPDGPPPEPPGLGVPRDVGAAWDFADVRRHYLRERHGPGATHEQEQRVTGEVLADVVGEWRRPGSPCAGVFVLWLRDLEPGAGWGLLDHAGRPKPAALALAPVLAPTALWFVDEGLSGLDVHVAHDPPEPVDLHLAVELRRADGSVVDAGEQRWTMPGHGHHVVGVEALLGRFADASWAYRFGPPAHAVVVARLTGPGSGPGSGPGGVREATWRVPRPPGGAP